MMQWSQLLRRYLRRIPPGSGNFTQDLDKFLPGNKLTLLNTGGEAFASMWEAMESARHTIHLETYIFYSDETGQEFADRLMAKARQGVSVRLIFDSIGSMEMDPLFLTRLRNAGVRVLEYHPVAPWRSNWAWSNRDHRKILVVDSRVAFTGGMNISHDHAPRQLGGGDWYDTHVKVEGPAAYELDRLFRAVWFKESKKWFPLLDYPDQTPGTSLVWVAANQEILHRHRIRSAYINALRAARREVLIANAYFIPDRGIRLALAAAARRGVAVKILVPGISEFSFVWHAGRRRFSQLLREGVRIFEWPGSILHAKTAVIDGVWCAVGSYNMDHRSLLHNLEVNVKILDCDLADQMKTRFERDLASSREITYEKWRDRPWMDKQREKFWYLFRYFF
ncbi:MAG TPA: cardiolipin synthase B [Elusimicrobia bacterium]|nr:cardiolipin synthase B [Elusimicrobiota bacterium]HBT60346.1 cardiolipin synthase B [Elusimicrobiota bacterium]